jgi:hypothetical protein
VGGSMDWSGGWSNDCVDSASSASTTALTEGMTVDLSEGGSNDCVGTACAEDETAGLTEGSVEMTVDLGDGGPNAEDETAGFMDGRGRFRGELAAHDSRNLLVGLIRRFDGRPSGTVPPPMAIGCVSSPDKSLPLALLSSSRVGITTAGTQDTSSAFSCVCMCVCVCVCVCVCDGPDTPALPIAYPRVFPTYACHSSGTLDDGLY